MARRVGSPRASKLKRAANALAMAYGKFGLTVSQAISDRSQGSELGLTRMTACGGYDSLGGDD